MYKLTIGILLFLLLNTANASSVWKYYEKVTDNEMSIEKVSFL
jgi:hypothetical protein